MKKVLSYVLALAMVLSSFSMAFAATPATTGYSDIAGEACEEAVTVLSSLGVIAGYTDGTYKPENTVTRAEMAKLVVVALGLEEFVGKTTSGFTDMVGNWADGYVGYAVSLGIVKGYGDGTFGPNDTVTYDQSITMIVRALGYTDNAKELVGTWPAAHIVLAKSLGITDDVTVGGIAGANRGDVAIMLNNALDETINYIDADGVTTPVNANSRTMLARLGVTADPAKVITRADADNSLISLADYEGFIGTPYVNDDDEIVAILDKTGTAYDAEVESISATKVTFTINDKEYVATPDALAQTIANTSAIAYVIGSYAVGDEVTVIGKMSGSTIALYSTVEWTATDGFQVADDQVTAISDKDANIFNADIIYDDDDNFDYVKMTVVGDATKLEDIQEDDIVVTYEDTNGDLVKITVARDVVTGKLTKVNTAGDEFTVNGTVYELNDQVTATNRDVTDMVAANTGNEYDLYLDYDGKIYIADEVSALGEDYAIVVGTGPAIGIGGSRQLEIITKDGEDLILDVESNADLTVTGAANFDAVASGSIILYSTNKTGVVTDIEAQAKVAAPNTADMSAKGVYANKLTDSNAVIFTFDAAAWNGAGAATFTNVGDDYDVTTLAKLLDESNFEAQYVLDSGDIVAMIIPDGITGSGDNTYGVINSFANTIDADDDAIYEISALVDGKTVTYTTTNRTGYAGIMAAKLSGAAFEFQFDGEGNVDGITNASIDLTPIKANYTTVTAINSSQTVITVSGQAVDIADDAVVYVVTFDDNAVDSYIAGSLSNISAGAKVTLYSTDSDNPGVADIIVVVKRADAIDPANIF